MTTDHDHKGEEEGAGTPVKKSEEVMVDVIVSVVEGDDRGVEGVEMSVAGTEVIDEAGALSSLDE